MPSRLTRIFSCSPLTVLVASATVAVPVAPLPPDGATVVVGASVGGVVAVLSLDLELLEHAASANAASAAAQAILTLDERIETSLGRVPRTSNTDVPTGGFNREPFPF